MYSLHGDGEIQEGQIWESAMFASAHKIDNLISTIEQLSDTQLSSAIHLISTMRYSKGANKGNIYSPYLQKKANEYINQTLYKR